jgi:hypothetical protein
LKKTLLFKQTLEQHQVSKNVDKRWHWESTCDMIRCDMIWCE